MTPKTKSEYVAEQSEAMRARTRAIRQAYPGSALIVATTTMLGKGGFDAVKPLRELLETSGFHSYSSQEKGRDLYGVEYVASYLLMDKEDQVSAENLDLVMLVTPTRGDPRFNIVRKRAGAVEPGDFLMFIVSARVELVIVNLGRGLSDPEVLPGTLTWSEMMGAVASVVKEPSVLLAPPMDMAAPRKDIVRARSQGRTQDSELRKCIEQRAVEAAKDYYLLTGASHIEELGKPYDLRVVTSDREFHVEVKGSLSEVDSVTVTKNEVDHARTTPGTELYVVDNISARFTLEAGWTSDGGRERRWEEWSPRASQLTALVYKFDLNDSPS